MSVAPLIEEYANHENHKGKVNVSHQGIEDINQYGGTTYLKNIENNHTTSANSQMIYYFLQATMFWPIW